MKAELDPSLCVYLQEEKIVLFGIGEHEHIKSAKGNKLYASYELDFIQIFSPSLAKWCEY